MCIDVKHFIFLKCLIRKIIMTGTIVENNQPIYLKKNYFFIDYKK